MKRFYSFRRYLLLNAKYEIQMFQCQKQRNGVKILKAYRNASGIRIWSFDCIATRSVVSYSFILSRIFRAMSAAMMIFSASPIRNRTAPIKMACLGLSFAKIASQVTPRR